MCHVGQMVQNAGNSPPVAGKQNLMDLREYAQIGRKQDIDHLMAILRDDPNFVTCKLIDYALSLVETREGVQRLKYYLFRGVQIQRNYAALYFKRKGFKPLLREALSRGCIDEQQAFSK